MMVMVILTFVLGGVIGDGIIGNLQTIKIVVVLIVRIVIQITMIIATRLPRT